MLKPLQTLFLMEINNYYLESDKKQMLYYKTIAEKVMDSWKTSNYNNAVNFSEEKSIKNFTDDEMDKLQK